MNPSQLSAARDRDRIEIQPDLFVAQNDRPRELDSVSIDELSPLHRTLLVVDGTVTALLEAYAMERIEVQRHFQEQIQLVSPNPWLEVERGATVVRREVDLRGRQSQVTYALAHSLLVEDRLPPGFLASMDQSVGGIGGALRVTGIENRRELLWYGRETSSGTDDGPQDYLTRTYRIISGGAPVILITEQFPLTYSHMSSLEDDR